MRSVESDYPNLTYHYVLHNLWNHGDHVAPRGIKTREFSPFVHTMIKPQNCLCSVPGRKANPFFNMAENMWILAGKGNQDWICSFNSKLAEFQADPEFDDFNAPYGRRIRFHNKHRSNMVQVNPYNSVHVDKMPIIDQLNDCYLKLMHDEFTRKAVVTLWNPIFDNYYNKTKDNPCNTTIYFKIRNKKLNITVSNRSNDIHLGLYGVNFVQFATIQQFMAAALGVGIGTYTHLSDSLHVYEESQHTKAILESDYDFDVYQHVNATIINREDIENNGMRKHKDVNLGDVLVVADEIISENILFSNYIGENSPGSWKNYKFRHCATNYARGAFYFLAAYEAHKKKEYLISFDFLKEANNFGFNDWFIQGLEFLFRSDGFVRDVSDTAFQYLKVKFPIDESYNSIVRYLEKH